jgi:hypothetical protein
MLPRIGDLPFDVPSVTHISVGEAQEALPLRGRVHIEHGTAGGVDRGHLLLPDPAHGEAIQESAHGAPAAGKVVFRDRAHAATVNGMERLRVRAGLRNDRIEAGGQTRQRPQYLCIQKWMVARDDHAER